MKFKRFMALALAGVMTLAMAGSAFAEPAEDLLEGDTSNSVSFTKTIDIAEGIADTSTPVAFKLEADDTWDPKYKNPSDFTFEPTTYSFSDLNSEKRKTDAKDISQDMTSAINKAGVYHFKLTETTTAADAGKFGWTKVDDTTYFIRVYAKSGENGLEYVYGIWKSAEDDNTKPDTKVEGDGDNTQVNFNNTYTEPATLSLKKAVDEKEYADAGQTYTFTVNIKLPDTAKNAEGVKVANATISGGETDSAEAITADGNYTVILKDNGEAKLENLPAGTIVKVTESLAGIVNFDNAKFEGTAGKESISGQGTEGNVSTNEFVLSDATNEVTCTNTYKDVTVTGLAISIAPFVAMFAAIGAAIALYVAAKRRVR